ncbi:hypothetical protein HK104_007798, partial [Borealophlyctis nickersoniae]
MGKPKVVQLLANVFNISPQRDARRSVIGESRDPSTVDFTADAARLARLAAEAELLARHRPRTLRARPWKGVEEEREPYGDLLNASVEYLALFKASRPGQTEVTVVEDMKVAEDLFAQLQQVFFYFSSLCGLDILGDGGVGILLLIIAIVFPPIPFPQPTQEVQDARSHLRFSLQEDIAATVRTLCDHMSTRVTHLRAAHERDMARVRRSSRAALADAIARIAYAAKKDREADLARLDQLHQDMLKQQEVRVFELKKESRKTADNISKLRAQIAKAQILLKKHGVTETDAYQIVNDERVRTDDLIDHYQSMVSTREDKIKQLTDDLTKLEARAVEMG